MFDVLSVIDLFIYLMIPFARDHFFFISTNCCLCALFLRVSARNENIEPNNSSISVCL